MSRRALRVGLLFLCGVLASSMFAEGGKRQPLNRSIYVPVQFHLCEHLKYGVLYVEDQPVAQLPMEHIFLFTYYPSLKRLEPPVTMARVEGVDLEGNPVSAQFAVSPKGIATTNKTIELDMQKQLKKLSYKIDVRYKLVKLRIACKKCGDPLPMTDGSPGAADQKVDKGSPENPPDKGLATIR